MSQPRLPDVLGTAGAARLRRAMWAALVLVAALLAAAAGLLVPRGARSAAATAIPLRAPVSAEVEAVRVVPGQHVESGDVLMLLRRTAESPR